MAHAGIPTEYRDRVYRSRLEARWACMFDLLGWDYEYEPYDLNGWIPDFLIFGARGSILAEIKPISTFGTIGTDEVYPQTDEERALVSKIRKAGAVEEVVLLGCTPFSDFYARRLGWFIKQESDWGADIDLALAGLPRGGDKNTEFDSQYDICAEMGSYGGRLFGGHKCWNSTEELPRLWAEAGNEVQWMKPRRPGKRKTKTPEERAKLKALKAAIGASHEAWLKKVQEEAEAKSTRPPRLST